jgi:DNA polymerase-4
MPGSHSDKRCILHADMDAFYASVEQRDHPELRGKPVAVGGSSQRGVVSAASYEARVYGVRSAMPSFEAKRLCPDLIFLQGDMASYSRESRRIFEIFGEFSPSVEGLSLDEAFLDLTGTERLMGAPRGIGERLRARVLSQTGLVVSVGIAPIKMVAKIASAACKPDGLLEVRADEVRAFLDPLPVRRIWGVGPVAERKLVERGMQTVGDLARADDTVLERLFGDWGMRLARLARGVDLREIEPHRAAISYSEENTFARDIGDYSHEGVLGATILTHAESVARRLRRDGVRARTVVLKWREAKRAAPGPRGYPLHTRQSTLFEATDDGDAIAREARRLLAEVGPREPVRLIGVGVSNVEAEGGARQLALFDGREASTPTAEADGKRDQLNRALDEITDRFGRDAVTRASQGKADRAGLTLQIKRGERPNPEPGKPD